jgi:predicted metal-dependent peptidase
MMKKHKMPAERRLELVHVSLMRDKRFAFFAGLFMVGKTTIVDLPLTARTNGRDAEYGRAFVDGLTDKELAFLVLHENMHKCYRHLTTWRALYDQNRRRANMACDYVINIQLRDMDPNETLIAMPRDKDTGKIIGLLDEKYRGMDTRQVWDLLEEEEKCHGQKPREGGGGQGGDQQSDSESESSGGFDEHDWEGAQEMSADEQKELSQEIDRALRQGGIYAGKVGGNVSRDIEKILQARVDWREVLQRFVRTSLTDRDSPSWRRAHKRYLWQDIILPSIMGKRMKSLAIGIDTSGSIQGELLGAFMGELDKAISTVNPDRVDIMYWDTNVARHEVYTGARKDVLATTRPAGGGGTAPDCVPKFMKDNKLKPDALIMLTDGYMNSDAGNWAGVECPILWCVIGNKNAAIPKGKVVRVE